MPAPKLPLDLRLQNLPLPAPRRWNKGGGKSQPAGGPEPRALGTDTTANANEPRDAVAALGINAPPPPPPPPPPRAVETMVTTPQLPTPPIPSQGQQHGRSERDSAWDTRSWEHPEWRSAPEDHSAWWGTCTWGSGMPTGLVSAPHESAWESSSVEATWRSGFSGSNSESYGNSWPPAPAEGHAELKSFPKLSQKSFPSGLVRHAVWTLMNGGAHGRRTGSRHLLQCLLRLLRASTLHRRCRLLAWMIWIRHLGIGLSQSSPSSPTPNRQTHREEKAVRMRSAATWSTARVDSEDIAV